VAVDPDFPRKILAGEDAESLVRPQRTGIALIDKMGMMEIAWYSRQLQRMGKVVEPKPHESARWALMGTLASQGVGTLRQRLRA
jgi:hypothetical protein